MLDQESNQGHAQHHEHNDSQDALLTGRLDVPLHSLDTNQS